VGPAGKGHKKVVPATGAAHTRHTVLGDAALKKGENRTLDFLPQKTVTRLEVLRPVPCKYLETRLEKPVVVGMFRMPPSLKTHAVFSALSVKGCRVPNADSGISSVSWLKGKGYISPEVARGTQTLKKGLFNEYIYYI